MCWVGGLGCRWRQCCEQEVGEIVSSKVGFLIQCSDSCPSRVVTCLMGDLVEFRGFSYSGFSKTNVFSPISTIQEPISISDTLYRRAAAKASKGDSYDLFNEPIEESTQLHMLQTRRHWEILSSVTGSIFRARASRSTPAQSISASTPKCGIPTMASHGVLKAALCMMGTHTDTQTQLEDNVAS